MLSAAKDIFLQNKSLDLYSQSKVKKNIKLEIVVSQNKYILK